MAEELTIAKLMKIKKMLDEAERKRPKIMIDGKEYITFGQGAKNDRRRTR